MRQQNLQSMRTHLQMLPDTSLHALRVLLVLIARFLQAQQLSEGTGPLYMHSPTMLGAQDMEQLLPHAVAVTIHCGMGIPEDLTCSPWTP